VEQPEQDFAAASELELVVMRVRLRAQRRMAWLERLREGRQNGGGGEPAWRGCLDERDWPEAEAAWYASAGAMGPLNERLGRIEAALAGDAGERLARLGAMFQLSEAELSLLQCCLALAMEPRLGVAYGELQQQPQRAYATEALAARLFGYGHRSLWRPGGALAVWKLVRAGEASGGEPPPLEVDPVVIDWLQGEVGLDADLLGRVHGTACLPPMERWPVGDTAMAIERILQRHPAVRVVVRGPAGSGRRSFAAAVAARFALETLVVDSEAIEATEWPDLFTRVQRLAVLGGRALVWHGDGVRHRWPRQIAPVPLQFLSVDDQQALPPAERVVDLRVELPSPGLEERRRLWSAALPESAEWPRREFETLVGRYHLQAGDIQAVGLRGPGSPAAAAALAREITRRRLGELGELLDCPFSWDDLVVPDKVRQDLEHFSFEARERSRFWESAAAQRLFPRGTGLVGLFSGPPGTGKTMAAQAIAATLELDLFRVDLATVVSKYIGETAKHLGQIFKRAARMNAVLLFDEADSLFSKRTEVKDSHDRYANADTSYLLQLLEDYDGIVILASNRKQSIDPAFLRRMRYVMDFPRPDREQRQRIWSQVIRELGGAKVKERLDADLTTLAEGVELSGAQIKNAVLSSIFIARHGGQELAMAHLLAGVERELGKENRSLGNREKRRLLLRAESRVESSG
jgi:adenylate kinase family enzyme